MPDFFIDVAVIEELQTIGNTDELDRLFLKAKSQVVQGETVALVRTGANGHSEQFDEISTEEDLDRYRQSVYKYL